MDTNQKRQRERRLQDKRRDKEMRRRERAEQKKHDAEHPPGPARSPTPNSQNATGSPSDGLTKAPPIPLAPQLAAQQGLLRARMAPSRAPVPSGGARGGPSVDTIYTSSSAPVQPSSPPATSPTLPVTKSPAAPTPVAAGSEPSVAPKKTSKPSTIARGTLKALRQTSTAPSDASAVPPPTPAAPETRS